MAYNNYSFIVTSLSDSLRFAIANVEERFDEYEGL